MQGSASSLSGARSYQEMGEFWGEQDLDEVWDRTAPAEFEAVSVEPQVRYYALDAVLAAEVGEFARKRGMSAGTLLNLWVKEKLQQPEQVTAAG